MDVVATAAQMRRAALAVFLASLAACAGNGDGLDANGRPLMPDGGGSPPPLSDDFESLQANIFTPICSVCHVGDGAPQGLRLDAANSFNFLVDVASTEVPTILRVKPGDPDNSYIIQKLEGHAAVGVQMPKGEAPLSAASIAFIREWISNGAAPADSGALAVPLAVTSILPARAAKLSAAPAPIMISLNAELDVMQVDADSMRIERVLADASTAPEGAAARITVSPFNLRALQIWPTQSLAPGHYRLLSSMTQLGALDGQWVPLGTVEAPGRSVITEFEVAALP